MEEERRASGEKSVEQAQAVGASKRILDAVWRLVSPVCDAEGMELIHVEFQREPAGRMLRLYIDKPGGVHLDDCVHISRQVGDLLDVACDELRGPYNLEVTSPGIHRPLGKLSDFSRFKGNRVKIRTAAPIKGRSNYTGMLMGIEKEEILVCVDDITFRIPYGDIAKAKLVGEYGDRK